MLNPRAGTERTLPVSRERPKEFIGWTQNGRKANGTCRVLRGTENGAWLRQGRICKKANVRVRERNKRESKRSILVGHHRTVDATKAAALRTRTMLVAGKLESLGNCTTPALPRLPFHARRNCRRVWADLTKAFKENLLYTLVPRWTNVEFACFYLLSCKVVPVVYKSKSQR